MSASPNTNIYFDSEAYTLQAILVKNTVKVKNDVTGSKIAPLLHIKSGDVLGFDRESSEYDYYVTNKTYEKPGEIMVKIVTQPGLNATAIQGLKISKKSKKVLGFVINPYGEYTYEIPKNTSWEKTQVPDRTKKGNIERIDYLGIKDNNLQFGYTTMKPGSLVIVPLAGSKNISNQKIILIPIDKKTFNIGKHRIEILSIKGSTITYKITS